MKKCLTMQADQLRDINIVQRTMNQLLDNAICPRGVYRFKTHEDADAWMTRMFAETQARMKSKK